MGNHAYLLEISKLYENIYTDLLFFLDMCFLLNLYNFNFLKKSKLPTFNILIKTLLIMLAFILI